MKKIVKFLIAGIVLVTNNFAMEGKEQPTILPKGYRPAKELLAGIMTNEKVIEGEDGIPNKAEDGIPKIEKLTVVEPNISKDRKGVMERRAQYFKDVIFSKGPDCFDLTRAGTSEDAAYVLTYIKFTYINKVPQSHFQGHIIDHSKTFASKEELVYCLQLLHNKVISTPIHVATIKAALNQLDGK